jgi:hypothetical protein
MGLSLESGKHIPQRADERLKLRPDERFRDDDRIFLHGQ